MRRVIFVCLILGCVAAWCVAAKKKEKEINQILELPKDPPSALAAETRSLVFHVSPLSSKGLLSQQIRDGMKALLKLNSGATFIKVRAFVAGTGDMRRVPALVSEILTEKKMPLPVVSVVQVGSLPMEGAQVLLESISSSRKETSPGGLMFTGGQEASVSKPFEPTLPLAQQAIASLDRVLNGAPPLRVTCLTSALTDAPQVQSAVAGHYPQAAVDVVVVQRSASRTAVVCDATASLPQRDFKLNGNEAAAVLSTRLAFTGTQVAFGFDDKDARLAFQRIEKALKPLGASTRTVAQANFYPLSSSIGEQVKKIRLEFFDPALLPPSTLLPFEGLPSVDASFAVDVVAAINR